MVLTIRNVNDPFALVLLVLHEEIGELGLDPNCLTGDKNKTGLVI